VLSSFFSRAVYFWLPCDGEMCRGYNKSVF
jgi:hypothetical protein